LVTTVAICPEKVGLLGEYEAATRNFAESVGDLRQKIGTSVKDEYERLQRASDEARVKSEQSRLSLEQHIAAHRC
jgi:hypothetical protein